MKKYIEYPCDCGHQEVKEHIATVYCPWRDVHFKMCATCICKVSSAVYIHDNNWKFEDPAEIYKFPALVNSLHFETEATFANVNALVLCVDTTKILAQMRDEIYKRAYRLKSVPRERDFKVLFDLAIVQQQKELHSLKVSSDNDEQMVYKDRTIFNNTQRSEFIKIYIDDYPTWKTEYEKQPIKK